MADLIQLLPDHIANQIAAGEVVQRPASIVKELLENAVDAGATEVQLIVREAGKELIQVVDNGCGMGPTDARMAFERHATSKIRSSDDLFAIRTMGFRGEALASIAAVAKVELRTMPHNETVGTRIRIEDGRVRSQEPCQCPAGSNLMVQHLFYNVPARRSFLKSDSVELRHMLEEFSRVALANPDIQFRAFNAQTEVYHLTRGKLAHRIAGLLGKGYRERLVPVDEETETLRVRGYVGKPEFAKRSRGQQYFFVNGRFIRSPYLHHAVKLAYDKLIADDTWPLYALFLELDPRHIDINVHPTKQEIKFEDERLVYQVLRVAVRHALGQFSVAPMIDFDAETALEQQRAPQARGRETVTTHILSSGVDYGAIRRSSGSEGARGAKRDGVEAWRDLYRAPQPAEMPVPDPVGSGVTTLRSEWREEAAEGLGEGASTRPPYQIHGAYIVHQVKSGYLLVDQQGAHERILYERYLAQLGEPGKQTSQRELFPTTLQLNGAQQQALQDLLPELERLGFEIAAGPTGEQVVYGMPADLPQGTDTNGLVEFLLHQHYENRDIDLGRRESIALSLARRGSVTRGTNLPVEAQAQLVEALLTTSHPEHTPSGRPCIITHTLEQLERQFGRA